MDIKASALAAVAAVALSGGAAQAVTFTFDTVAANQSSVYFTQDGLGFTVTAGVGLGTPYVTQESDGLGVYTDRTGRIFDDTDSDVDGQPGTEYLLFTFDSAVKLVNVLFGDADNDDDWDVIVDGELIANDVDDNPFYFAYREATTLKVRADGLNDSWRVQSLQIAPVPLPATGLMLVGALGGLGLLRRRRKAA